MTDTASGIRPPVPSADRVLGLDEPLSGGRLNFRKYQVSDNSLPQRTVLSSREDPSNIIGDVYIGKDRSKTVRNKESFS